LKRTLLTIGADTAALRMVGGAQREVAGAEFESLVQLVTQLESLDDRMRAIGGLRGFLEATVEFGAPPRVRVTGPEPGASRVFADREAAHAWLDEHAGGVPDDPSAEDGAAVADLHEAELGAGLLAKLEERGFSVDDVYGQKDTDRFEVVVDAETVIRAQGLVDVVVEVGRLAEKGVDIQRYKGLGEMNADQLWDSTMNPETRTLYPVVLENEMEADHLFSVLMGPAVEPRREFIAEHALEVRNLDI
jgi:DNA gyrase subunit B